MFFSWSRRWLPTQADALNLQRHAARRQRSRERLRVEMLEDRTLFSVDFSPGPLTTPAHLAEMPLGLNSPLPVEPALAINGAATSTDPGEISISSQSNIRVSTTDGGAFTSPHSFPNSSSGDSTSVFDNAGRLFWVNLNKATEGLSIVQVNPGTGKIIAGPFTVDAPKNARDDKPFLAVDPVNNNLFVAWTQFASTGTTVFVSRSTNQGVTWSTPKAVSGAGEGFVWGATISIAPNTDVFVAYHSQTGFTAAGVDGVGNPNGTSGKTFVAHYSDDLSERFSKTLAFGPGQSDITFNVQSAPRTIPHTQFWTQGSAQPWVLADPTRPGNIYVVTADDPSNGTGAPYARVVFARSTDYGLTWSSPTFVAPEAGSSFQLFPTASIDRFGDLVVAWYDNRRGRTNSNGHFLLDVFATYSTDGGSTWATPFMVNAPGNPFDPDAGAAIQYKGPPPTTRIGDNLATGIFAGTAYVAWNGNLFSGTTPIGQQVWFDPFAINGSLTISGDDNGPTNDTITLMTMPGNPAFAEVLVNNVRQFTGLWSSLTGGITINGGEGNDTINIENTVAGDPVTVNLGDGLDTVNISPVANKLANIQGNITINDGSGVDTLNINDQADHVPNQKYDLSDTTLQVPTLSGAVIAYHLSGDSNMLTLNGGTANTGTYTYNVRNTANLFQTTLNTGKGVDLVNVQATTGSLVVASAGTAGVFSTVNVGNAGSVQHILAPVTVTNTSFTTLNVDDSADSAPRSVTLSESAITGLAPAEIRYVQGSLKALTIRGGRGGNTFTVENTPNAGGVPLITTLDTGSGKDSVVVSRTTGILTIDGEGGSDTVGVTADNGVDGVQNIKALLTVRNTGGSTALTLDDSPDMQSKSATIGFGAITGLAPAEIAYSNLSKLTVEGGTGGNNFTVSDTPDAYTYLYTGGGGDTVNVKATKGSLGIDGQLGLTAVNVGNSGSVRQLIGEVDIVNGGGITNLTVDDSADPLNQIWKLGALTPNQGFLRNQSMLEPITYTTPSLSALNVLGGRGNNTWNVYATPLAATTINAGNSGGLETVTVGNGTTQNILGILNVTNTASTTALTVDDSADTASQDVTVTSTSILDLAPAQINYSSSRTFLGTTTLELGPGELDAGNTVNVLATAGPMAIAGNGGRDTVDVGNNTFPFTAGVQDITGSLSITNTDALTDLIVDDSSDPTSRSATLSQQAITGLAPAPITFNQDALNSLTLYGGGGGNTFTVNDTPSAGTTLNTGTGNNSVTVKATTGSLSVIGGVGDFDFVKVGNTVNGLQQIAGDVTVSNPDGATSLTVTDLADPIDQTFTMGVNNDLRLGNVTFLRSGFNSVINYDLTSTFSLTVNGGSGKNTFQIGGIDPSAQTTINLGGNGGANANVTLPKTTLSGGGSLTINGSAGKDPNLTLDDSTNTNAANYTINSTSVSNGSATINYANITTLALKAGTGAAGNTFTVQSTAQGTATAINDGNSGDTVNVEGTTGPLTVNVGTGEDTINVSPTAMNLANIQGNITIGGQAGNDQLTINDQNNAVDTTYTISAATVSQAGSATINYGSIGKLVVNGGSGNNTYNVLNTASAAATTLVSGAGNDTINISGTSKTTSKQGPPLTVTMGDGNNTINVGGGNSLNAIVGMIALNAGAGNNLLNINDQGSAGLNSYFLYGMNFTRNSVPILSPALISFTGISNIVLRAGQGTNVVFFRNLVPTVTGGPRVFVDPQSASTTIVADQGTVSTDQVQFTQVDALQVNSQGTLDIESSLAIPNFTVEGGNVNLDNNSVLQITNIGSWSGGTIGSSGTLKVAAGATLTIDSKGGTDTLDIPTLDNAGTIDLSSATIQGTGKLVNLTGAVLSGQGSIGLSITNNGELDLADGTTVGALINNGLFNIGNPGMTGTVNITGDYTQSSTGVLNVKIAGNNDSDVLAIGGAATLSGTLNLELIDGYQPMAGQTIKPLTFAGGLTGRFATINGLGLGDDDGDFDNDLFYIPSYQAKDLLFTVMEIQDEA